MSREDSGIIWYDLTALPRSVDLAMQFTGDHLLHRSLAEIPHAVVYAKGLELHLRHGQIVLDACGGAAVACIGHGNEEVASAIAKQVRQVDYVHMMGHKTSVAELLADNPLFGARSGSEAVDSALKLARQYHFENGEPERLHIVSRRQSYHGNTIGSISISSNLARKVPYEGFVYPHVSHVTSAFAYRYQREDETEEQFATRLLGELDNEFCSVGPSKIVAFVAETVVGAAAGCIPAPKGYFSGVRVLCDKYGIIMILDEIMCGTGRTGTFFAFEQKLGPDGAVVRPDIVTVAKGLARGYGAIGGFYVNAKIVDTLRLGSQYYNHGHTYQAHPISRAAALAMQLIIKRDGLVERCREMGQVLSCLLHKELLVPSSDGEPTCRSVGDIRGRELFWAVEFVRDSVTKEPFDPAIKFGVQVQEELFRNGVAVYPGAGTADGGREDHVLLAPPFNITGEDPRLKETIRTVESHHL